MSHSIRLRGPWEFSLAGSDVAGRVDFPCTWRELAAAVAAPLDERSVLFLRRFGKPTGLLPGDRVWLSLRQPGGRLTAHVNGAPLTLNELPDGSHAAEVTNQLAERNELAIALASPSPALLDARDAMLEVVLEIHPVT